jgi:spore germination protein
MRQARLKLFPMLTTDMADKELAEFAKNEKNLQSFLENLIAKLKNYQADGLDLDFENIGSQYSSDFSFLVKNISEELKKQNLKFSLTIQAQTGKDDWDGLKGQDLSFLPQYADEVRIMAYDRHGEFSEPGPITPMDWYADVLEYNLKFIPREKIVIGLPTYGYIWQENRIFQSFQFKEFVSYAKSKNFETSRDPESFELKYAKKSATGWLSDSASVIKKIEYARKTGVNRFVIWNLGGTDENLFQKKWETLKIEQIL